MPIAILASSSSPRRPNITDTRTREHGRAKNKSFDSRVRQPALLSGFRAKRYLHCEPSHATDHSRSPDQYENASSIPRCRPPPAPSSYSQLSCSTGFINLLMHSSLYGRRARGCAYSNHIMCHRHCYLQRTTTIMRITGTLITTDANS